MNTPLRSSRWVAGWLLVPALLLPAAVVVPAEEQQAPPQRHMLWHVNGAGGEGWMIGSLHFGTPDLYPLAQPFERAWDASGELLVELDISALSPLAMQQTVTREGVYANDTQLELHLPVLTWQRTKEAASRYGLPLVLLQQQRPWLAAITLTTLELQRGGWREDLGLDLHFIGRDGDDRPVLELETFEQQIGLFSSLSEKDQVVMLESTLDDLYSGNDVFAQMLSAWRDGDTSAMDALINQSIREQPGGEHVFRVLISNRNKAMARRFEERLAVGARPLMVVGAAHLVGRQGVPALLRERGFEVQQAVTRTDAAASQQ